MEHNVRRWEAYPETDTGIRLWRVYVEYEGEYYEAQAEVRKVSDDKMYYTGYIRNT